MISISGRTVWHGRVSPRPNVGLIATEEELHVVPLYSRGARMMLLFCVALVPLGLMAGVYPATNVLELVAYRMLGVGALLLVLLLPLLVWQQIAGSRAERAFRKGDLEALRSYATFFKWFGVAGCGGEIPRSALSEISFDEVDGTLLIGWTSPADQRAKTLKVKAVEDDESEFQALAEHLQSGMGPVTSGL